MIWAFCIKNNYRYEDIELNIAAVKNLGLDRFDLSDLTPLELATILKSTLKQTCVFDVVSSGPKTLEYIGDLLGITRERIRQIEKVYINRIRKVKFRRDLIKDFASL